MLTIYSYIIINYDILKNFHTVPNKKNDEVECVVVFFKNPSEIVFRSMGKILKKIKDYYLTLTIPIL